MYHSICSDFKHPPKNGEGLKRCSRCHIIRILSFQGLRCLSKGRYDETFAGEDALSATAASSARDRIGTFTGLLVAVWSRSRTLWKLKYSATRTFTYL